MLRKTIASFLVFLIAVLAVPVFVVFGMSRTYFSEDFYRGDVVKVSYDFLVKQSVQEIYDSNNLIQSNFPREDFEKIIKESFTQNMFSDVLNDFVKQVFAMIKGESVKLILNLQLFRDSLLSAMNTLAYKVYQKLPTCSEADLATIKFGNDLPTCVPPNTDYDIVVSPLIQNFQNEVYQKIPKEISNIDRQLPIDILQNFFIVKNVLFIILIVLLSLIALLMWRPFSGLVLWEGVAFLASGLVGLALSYFSLEALGVDLGLNQESLVIQAQLIGFLTDEIRRLALMFLIIGVALIVVRVIIKRTMENERLGFK